MILFRVRQWGRTEWTEIRVTNSLETDDDSDMEGTIGDLIEDALGAPDLHVQQMSDEGRWEDLE